MAAKSQLRDVISGNKDIKSLSESAAKSALAEATGKLTRLQKAKAKMEENGAAVATATLTTLEMHGANALASFASGYRGPGGLNIGPVDVRWGGGALIAWGLYDCLMGNGGHHQLAVGNGLVASLIAENSMAMGAMVAEQSGEAPQPAVADNSSQPALTVSPEFETVEGDVREIILEPTTDGHRKPPRRKPSRHQPPRHRRPRPRREYDEDDD